MSNSHNLLTSGLSPSSSTSTIRPRNRRLISGLEEPGDISNTTKGSSNLLGSPPASPRPSRAPSPLPSQHPSRLPAASGYQAGGFGQGGTLISSSSLSPGFLESSWTTLQGLASTVLGNDSLNADGQTARAGRSPFRRRKPSIAQRRRAISAAPPDQWGPAGTTSPNIGGGSQVSREAQIRAKKREELLSNGNGSVLTDSSGKYKRRLSDDRNGLSSSAPPSEHGRDEGDAMVYVYHVQPNDTLAGIVLKFSCQITAFRRVNRLWPNDSIQSRKVVAIPVDACSIKGRPCSPPPEPTPNDILGEDPRTSTHTESSAWPGPQPESQPRIRSESLTTVSSATTNPTPWQHQSYVLLPTIPTPISLARLPRKSLNYFPPRRRLSQSSSTLSTTPSHSFDLSRSPKLQAHSPSRSNTRVNRANSSTFYAHLTGPGGVGSLHPSSSNPHIPLVPGPAPDNLNKYLAPHLPSVTPPADNGYTTPSEPLPGLENVGAAIEGWMRKMAARAQGALEPPKSRMGRSAVSEGDLIELSDGFEGADLFDTEEERGRYRAGSGEGTGRMQLGKDSMRGRKGIVHKED